VRLVPPGEAVKSEAPKAEPAMVSAKAPDCLQAAPLDDAATEAVRRVLASWPAASWTLEPLAEAGRWIVYMGKYANAENVERKKAQLRQIGVAFEPLSAPDLEPGLSLGGFASEAEANQQLERLAARGVRTAHVVQERPAARGQRLTLPAVDDALRPKLDEVRAVLAGKTLRACR
jgi:cell division septation protein DedD